MAKVKNNIENVEEKVGYDYYFKEFREPYQPKYAFCPTLVIARIEKYWDVDYQKAVEIYKKSSTYLGSVSRLNDFLYEKLVIESNK